MTGEVDRDAKFPQLGILLASRRVAAAGSDPLTSEIHGKMVSRNDIGEQHMGLMAGFMLILGFIM